MSKKAQKTTFNFFSSLKQTHQKKLFGAEPIFLLPRSNRTMGSCALQKPHIHADTLSSSEPPIWRLLHAAAAL